MLISGNIHATVTGQGPDVILIHGLFGMGSNLGALARSLQGSYTLHSIDLPNHGRSAWMEPADIPAMAGALASWMDSQGLPGAALVGHSLGGKVAMELALRAPQRVDALVVADIAPVEYPASHQSEFEALTAVAAAHCRSRTEAKEIMLQYLEQDMVIQFLLMSLTREADGIYRWRFNLAQLMASYGAIRAAIAAGPPYAGPVMFIKGGESRYIQEHHRAQILTLFPQADLKLMPGCGHWLHAEQPRLFNGIVERFLQRCDLATGDKGR